MSTAYKPRHSIPLQAGATYERPPQPADWVQPNDPALNVFTDFRVVQPRTVHPAVSIDAALDQMKRQGVRLLLVVDDRDEITGIITARDIQGEKPIQLIQERRIEHSELTVRDIMRPQGTIPVLNMISVREATVGHILATLHELERQHVLVVEIDETTGRQCVRGVFSTSQIDRQMHRRKGDDIPAAHNLAEIVKNMG